MKASALKAPLENPIAERTLLGALLRDTTAFYAVRDRMPPSLFAVDRNQAIAKVMHSLVDEGRSLSPSSVLGQMPFDSEFSAEGYLAALVSDSAHQDEIESTVTDLQRMQARREMIRFGEALIRAATEDPTSDPLTRLEAAREAVTHIGDPFTETVRHVSDIIRAVGKRVNESYKAGTVAGLDIGLKGVQDLIGPLLPGRLYMVCGSPGSGKSALMAQMAEHIARDHAVLINQIEMPGEEQVERLLAPRAGLLADSIERAALDAAEIDRLMDAGEAMRDLKLWIDSSTSPSVAQIRSRAQRMQREHDLRAVFIDHLLYIAPRDRRLKEHEAVRENLQGLKQMAKDLRLPVVCLTQPVKEYSSGPVRRPKVSDLYGGAANEQEADAILLLFREEYMLRRNEPNTGEGSKEFVEWKARLDVVEGKAEAILGKRRGGKGFGIRSLYFEAEAMRFHDNVPRRYRDISQGTLYDDPDIPA